MALNLLLLYHKFYIYSREKNGGRFFKTNLEEYFLTFDFCYLQKLKNNLQFNFKKSFYSNTMICPYVSPFIFGCHYCEFRKN